MVNRRYIVRGKYNEILSKNIGDGTIISGWTFIGKNVRIGRNCRFGNYVNIDAFSTIGDNVNIQPGTVITMNSVIEDDVFMGAGVYFIDEKYPSPFASEKIRMPITVRSGALIGTAAKIVCSRVGRNAVVGAGSLVIKDVPDNEVWVGSPAKFVMTRKEFDNKRETVICAKPSALGLSLERKDNRI